MEVDEELAPQEDQAVPAVAQESPPAFNDDELDAMEEKEPPWLDEA